MLTNVDRNETHTIQKVTSPKMDVHFQTIETAKIGKGGQATPFDTLMAARTAIGKTIRHPVKETAKASSYAEQCTGYSKSK